MGYDLYMNPGLTHNEDKALRDVEAAARTAREQEILQQLMDLSGENAALRARIAELEAGQGWRPVSEEPEESGEYLVGSARDGVDIAYWQQEEDEEVEYTMPTVIPATWFREEMGLPLVGEKLWFTHWMPKPEPPTPQPTNPGAVNSAESGAA